MKPRIPITDPAFKYTPAAMTNLRETFKRVRAQMARDALNPANYGPQPRPAIHGRALDAETEARR